MRSPVDALRSVKRYVALAVGPDWEVRLSSEKGVFARPYARVAQIPSFQFVPLRLPVVRILSSYQIVLYPTPGLSADESQLSALSAMDLLWNAFSGPGVGMGRTERVPLYNYDGVALTAGADESHRAAHDFMLVESPPSVTPYVDPANELLWSVAANIRMSWLRSAAVPSTARTTVRVGVGAQTNG